MGNKLSNLPPVTTPASSDVVPVVATGVTSKVTVANLLATLVGLLASGDISWAKVSKTGSSLADLATKAADALEFDSNNRIVGRFSDLTAEIPLTDYMKAMLALDTEAALKTYLNIDTVEDSWALINPDDYSSTLSDSKYLMSDYTLIPYTVSTVSWAPGITPVVGVYYIPSTPNGRLYQCTVSTGVTSATEPSWGTNLNVEYTDSMSNVWECRSAHIITLNRPLTVNHSFSIVGRPVKWLYSGETEYNYGLVEWHTATALAISGEPLDLSKEISDLRIGQIGYLKQIDYRMSGSYIGEYYHGSDPTSDPYAYMPEIWYRGHVVKWAVRHTADDSTDNPIISLQQARITDISQSIQVTTDVKISSPGSMEENVIKSYESSPGEREDRLQPVVDADTSATGDAQDLHVRLWVVVE